MKTRAPSTSTRGLTLALAAVAAASIDGKKSVFCGSVAVTEAF